VNAATEEQFERGKALLDAGRFARAAAEFRELQKSMTVAAIVHPGPEQQATDYFAKGFEAIRRGVFEEAEAQVKAGLNLDPRSPAGYDLLGIIYDGEGRFQQAAQAYRKALELNPKFVRARDDLGMSLYRGGQVLAAQREFARALALEPKNFTANYNLGLIAQKSKRYKESQKYLETARGQAPSDPQVSLALATAYFGTGETERALSVARRGISFDPDNPRIRFSWGALFLEWKEYAEAAEQLERARALEPQDFEVLYDLGQAYIHLREYAEAEDTFLHCVSVQTESVDALYQLAVVYTRSNHADEAIQMLVRARQLAPKRPDVLLLLARDSIQEGFVEDAAGVLEECVEIDPDKIEPHLLLGEVFSRNKEFPKALAEYETVVRLEPTNPEYHVLVGRTLKYLGRDAQAEQPLRRALQLGPKNAHAAFYLGLIDADQGNLRAAQSWLEQSIQNDSTYMAAYYELGVVSMKRQNYVLARRYLDRARTLSPNFAPVYYRLATAYRRLGQPARADEALALFKKYDQESRATAPRGILEFVQETQNLPEKVRLERYRAALLKAEERKPDDINLLFMLARIELGLGEKEQAFQTLGRINALQDSVAVHLRAAALLTSYNTFAEAIEQLESALEKHPDADEARFALASLYEQMHRTAEAGKVLRAMGPRSRGAAYEDLLGRVHGREGNSAAAVRELERAVSLEPGRDQYVTDLTLELALAGRTAEAGRVLEKARRDWPSSSKILFAVGLWQQLAGHLEKAEVAFRQAADLSWRWEAPSLALGNLYSKSQAPGRAVETLSQAVTLFPSSPWPHWFKALALTNATPRREEQALSELELSQELAPNQPEIYPALLVLALRRNDCSGAARIWMAMTPFGLARELDPSQWCESQSDSTSRRTAPPDNLFDQYSETRLLAEMASDNSDSPLSGR